MRKPKHILLLAAVLIVLLAVCGMALGYFVYRKGMPFLMSSAFYPLIGDKIYGPIGKAIDMPIAMI